MTQYKDYVASIVNKLAKVENKEAKYFEILMENFAFFNEIDLHPINRSMLNLGQVSAKIFNGNEIIKLVSFLNGKFTANIEPQNFRLDWISTEFFKTIRNISRREILDNDEIIDLNINNHLSFVANAEIYTNLKNALIKAHSLQLFLTTVIHLFIENLTEEEIAQQEKVDLNKINHLEKFIDISEQHFTSYPLKTTADENKFWLRELIKFLLEYVLYFKKTEKNYLITMEIFTNIKNSLLHDEEQYNIISQESNYNRLRDFRKQLTDEIDLRKKLTLFTLLPQQQDRQPDPQKNIKKDPNDLSKRMDLHRQLLNELNEISISISDVAKKTRDIEIVFRKNAQHIKTKYATIETKTALYQSASDNHISDNLIKKTPCFFITDKNNDHIIQLKLTLNNTYQKFNEEYNNLVTKKINLSISFTLFATQTLERCKIEKTTLDNLTTELNALDSANKAFNTLHNTFYAEIHTLENAISTHLKSIRQIINCINICIFNIVNAKNYWRNQKITPFITSEDDAPKGILKIRELPEWKNFKAYSAVQNENDLENLFNVLQTLEQLRAAFQEHIQSGNRNLLFTALNISTTTNETGAFYNILKQLVSDKSNNHSKLLIIYNSLQKLEEKINQPDQLTLTTRNVAP